MSLSADEVKKIAHLARLSISEAEMSSSTKNLSKILDLVEQMNAVDTDGVTPMAHPMDAIQRLRVDEVNEHDQRELLQSIAPETESGLYLVPKVIE